MIYSEIVHLSAEDKVLIEVLDGRSVRLTFDAAPLEILYNKKKITAINIDEVPYLSLENFNKVFVTISERLHVYSITEIDQINDNCFQCHTMPRTKSSFFVTPMLGNTRSELKWGQYFVNTFLSEDSIVLLYRYFNVEDFQQFEHELKKHSMFQRLIDYDIQHVAFQFKIPQEMLGNLKLFSAGKYSQMSDSYRSHILKFHALKLDTTIGKILFKSDERRKQLELDLGVSIPEDVELYDIPDGREVFKDNKELILEV